MSENLTPTQIIEGLNKDFKAFKDEMSKKTVDPEKIAKIEDALDKYELKFQQLNTVPPNNHIEGKMSKEDIEYKSSFDVYARKGVADERLEKKQMSTDSNPDGGYMVPVTMADHIIERVRQSSPIRQLANIVPLSNSNEYKVPRESTDDFDSGWVGEREDRQITDNGKIEMVSIKLHEQYAQPALTRSLITDSNFDFESYINKKVGNKFARQEATAFVTGDGVNKPLGFLHAPDKQGIELVTGGLDFDGIIDLQTSLLEEYQPNASFLINRLSLRAVRKLKDTQGHYLWEPSTQIGKPNLIIGFPYHLAADMPSPGTGAYSIAFADWSQAYTIVDGKGIYSIRDELTKKPFIQFYTTRRVGGGIEMPDAIKILKQQ